MIRLTVRTLKSAYSTTTMTLDNHEFIRRFLIHILPTGFHRMRYYGLLVGGVKADNLALARKLLDVAPPAPEPEHAASDPAMPATPCPCCGSAMRIIEVFKAGELPRHRPTAMPAAIAVASPIWCCAPRRSPAE
jgi:hypothetical protein